MNNTAIAAAARYYLEVIEAARLSRSLPRHLKGRHADALAFADGVAAADARRIGHKVHLILVAAAA